MKWRPEAVINDFAVVARLAGVELPKSRSKNLRFIDKGLAVSNA